MLFRATLLAGAAGAVLAATPAQATEAEATAAADAQPTAAGTGAGDRQDEILVTARRRQETAQDIPLAISVIGGEHIDNTGSFNVGRLQQLTPTLQYYSSNPRNTAVNIRGIGAPFGLTNDGIEQGVGIYVDDVYYSRIASATSVPVPRCRSTSSHSRTTATSGTSPSLMSRLEPPPTMSSGTVASSSRATTAQTASREAQRTVASGVPPT